MVEQMKTIKQIADEIGVSKQAVQKRISREPLYKKLYLHVQIVGQTKQVDEIGEMLIKAAYNEDLTIDTTIDTIDTTIDKNGSTIDKTIENGDFTIDNYRQDYIQLYTTIDKTIDKPNDEYLLKSDQVGELLTMLKKELDIKNEQIRELNMRLSESNAALVSAQQTAQAAQALHAGTIQKSLESGTKKIEEEKQEIGLFSWMFNKKN
jgi:predicted DNA binding protein